MSEWYVLNEAGEAQPVGDGNVGLEKWARWSEANQGARVVGNTQIGDVIVSTVFLGMNHQWGSGPPLIFETMIFEGEYDQWGWRWSTRAEAVAKHDQIAAALREGKSPDEAVTS